MGAGTSGRGRPSDPSVLRASRMENGQNRDRVSAGQGVTDFHPVPCPIGVSAEGKFFRRSPGHRINKGILYVKIHTRLSEAMLFTAAQKVNHRDPPMLGIVLSHVKVLPVR